MRVGIYGRLSTQDRGDLEAQLSRLRTHCEARGWEVAGEYTDRLSGITEKRPGLDRLVQDCWEGKIEAVVVVGLDRLGRSLKHLLDLAQTFQDLGVELVSLREQIDTSSPVGRFFFQVVGAFAELERSLISERIRSGLARARTKGKRLGRRPKVFHRDRVQVLRAEGLSWRRIARALGISTRTAQRLWQNPQANCATQASIKSTGSPDGRRTSESSDSAPGVRDEA